MGKEQVDEKHEIKFFEIIYKLEDTYSVTLPRGLKKLPEF